MHKLLVLANALVGQNRPGEDRTTGARRRGSRRDVRRSPPRELSSPRRRAPCWRSRRPPRGCTEPEVAVTIGHQTPVTEPQRHSPGLRPGAREGEPQARRCRSRVSVPSSVVGRGAGRRLDPSGAAMHKLLVLANALVGQNRPGEDRTTGARRRGSRRDVRRPPPRELSSPRRRAPCWRSRRPPRGCTEPEVAVTIGHQTPVTEPQRHSPRSTTGGAGGRAAGEAMPFPRQRSVVGRWTGGRSAARPVGRRPAKLLVLANALQLRLTRRPLWPQAATSRGRRQVLGWGLTIVGRNVRIDDGILNLLAIDVKQRVRPLRYATPQRLFP